MLKIMLRAAVPSLCGLAAMAVLSPEKAKVAPPGAGLAAEHRAQASDAMLAAIEASVSGKPIAMPGSGFPESTTFRDAGGVQMARLVE